MTLSLTAAITLHMSELDENEINQAKAELNTLLELAWREDLQLVFQLIENASDYMRPQVGEIREHINRIAYETCDNCNKIAVNVEIEIEGLSYTSSGPVPF